ncbi:MAG: PEP-CTERM sorting domain-containing protein [Phycisphaerales bacterium]
MLNLFGTSFFIDGNDITSQLAPGESKTLSVRDVILSGTLADETPFDFDMTTVPDIQRGYFDPDAVITITLVPEPATMFLLGFGIGAATCRRARPL